MLRWLRRWPPLTWLFVYVGSILVLMGSQHRHLAVVGMSLILIAFGIALYLATGPQQDKPRPPGFLPALGFLALFYLVCTAVAASVGWGVAVAALAAGFVPMTALTLAFATARSKTAAGEHGLRDTSIEDDSPYAAVGMDDETPLGDTPEAHDEITPHDLPVGHPGRKEAEREAGAPGGATRGNR
jgi:hypothetical protein